MKYDAKLSYKYMNEYDKKWPYAIIDNKMINIYGKKSSKKFAQ